MKAGRIAFKFEIPMPLITISSEFLIKINRAKIDEKKEVIGSV